MGFWASEDSSIYVEGNGTRGWSGVPAWAILWNITLDGLLGLWKDPIAVLNSLGGCGGDFGPAVRAWLFIFRSLFFEFESSLIEVLDCWFLLWLLMATYCGLLTPPSEDELSIINSAGIPPGRLTSMLIVCWIGSGSLL